MGGYEHLLVEKRKHIAWVILNRPEKRNALSVEIMEKMTTLFQELDNDSEVRVIVIRGAGKNFCSGMELDNLAGFLKNTGADYRELLRRKIIEGQGLTNAVEACRKPVILAVHGHCIGAGVDLACACDIRIASVDAIFAVRETKLALIADLGTLQRLPGIVGESWARELMLTGKDFSAKKALQIGFITHLCDDPVQLEQKAEALAAEIAENAPLAVQGVKDALYFGARYGALAGLEYVAQKNAAILISEDSIEAIKAALEKRKPIFRGR